MNRIAIEGLKLVGMVAAVAAVSVCSGFISSYAFDFGWNTAQRRKDKKAEEAAAKEPVMYGSPGGVS